MISSSKITLNQDIDRGYLSSINIGILTLYKEISKQYNDNEILTYVNQMIPRNVLIQFNDYICYEEQSFKAIFQWFKNEFMKWMPKNLQCNVCNIQMKVQLLPGDSWKLRSTEIYECIKCGSKCVFPRYGEIKKIADTRIGRCSEWSMVFGAILNSLSIPARIVHDYLDHCWNESYIGQEWIHMDSTLAYPISLNHPYYYEQNWSKKYEYIMAFSADSIEDVTRRYTEKWDSEVLARRIRNNTDRKIDAFTKLYLRL
jgi:peptide-N4-(N-acetyl-beta-glucosaminyl)asparagine amidase